MAKNTNFVSHKKSKQKNQDGTPQLPLASALVEGEIAINFAENVETLSIKNESGNVVTFSSDNYYTEKKLGSAFTGANSAVTVTDVIEENEEIVATALNDLNENKLDASAYTPTDLSNYYTKSETSSKTEIDSAILWEAGSGNNAAVLKNSSGTASGDFAVAEGISTSATSDYSHAEGENTTASGRSSHAEGAWTIASGIQSHAEGLSTSATSYQSHAEGYGTLASGDYSHAEGRSTIASGYCSHAEGQSTKAFGDQSHAEGQSTSATSYQTHAEGYGTLASGVQSHAEGSNTTASGNYSHAEGYSTNAIGSRSHAEGSGTIASGDYSHAEGYSTSATSIYTHAEGDGTKANGNNSHAEGYNTIARGVSSHAEGYQTHAEGENSHSEGRSTEATGHYSHAEGYFTIASSNSSHTEGKNTKANNQSEHASGQYNISSSASTEFGNSGNTLFSVGNGTADDARHNAFEIRQNGDIYIVDKNGNDILLQDNLGGGASITVDQVLDNTTSASTNPVSSKAVYDAVTDNELVWTNAYVTLSGTVSAHTSDTTIHVTSTDKTNWNNAVTSSHTHNNKSALDAITGNVGTMAYQSTDSYSSATEVNNALSAKVNSATYTGHTADTTVHFTTGTVQTQIDNSISGKVNTSDIVSAITPSNSASTAPIATKVVAENELVMTNALTDLDDRKLDASAYTPTDLSDYYTKSQTSGATELSTAFAEKVDGTTFSGHTADTTIHSISVVSAVTVSADLTNVTCPTSITGSSKSGAQAIVIYQNDSTTTDYNITVSTSYKSPDGQQIDITCPKNGYCEISYINIGGTIYVRGT